VCIIVSQTLRITRLRFCPSGCAFRLRCHRLGFEPHRRMHHSGEQIRSDPWKIGTTRVPFVRPFQTLNTTQNSLYMFFVSCHCHQLPKGANIRNSVQTNEYGSVELQQIGYWADEKCCEEENHQGKESDVWSLKKGWAKEECCNENGNSNDALHCQLDFFYCQVWKGCSAVEYNLGAVWT